jgi:hypothetical protein
VGFHYRVIWATFEKLFSAKNLDFFSNYMRREQLCAVETHKFFEIFLSKLSIKNRVSFSQTCLVFSKMVSTNHNGFPLKGYGFPLQGVFFNCLKRLQKNFQ